MVGADTGGTGTLLMSCTYITARFDGAKLLSLSRDR
jgi:hypothetical protein